MIERVRAEASRQEASHAGMGRIHLTRLCASRCSHVIVAPEGNNAFVVRLNGRLGLAVTVFSAHHALHTRGEHDNVVSR